MFWIKTYLIFTLKQAFVKAFYWFITLFSAVIMFVFQSIIIVL